MGDRTTKGVVFRWLVLFVGAIAGWGLWFAELLWVKGWAGTAWLAGFNWSAVPICVLAMALCVHFLDGHAARPDRLRFVASASALTLAAFAAARWALLEMFGARGPGSGGSLAFVVPGVLLVAVLGLSAGLVVMASRWIVPLPGWTTALVVAALLVVVPLSYATVQVVPALNGGTDEVHAIKMGYPAFWCLLLVPIALRLGVRRGA